MSEFSSTQSSRQELCLSSVSKYRNVIFILCPSSTLSVHVYTNTNNYMYNIKCIISLNSFYLISIIRIKQRIVWRLNTIYNCVSKPRYFKSCCISRAISFENNSETVAAAGDWYGICVATSFDNQTFIRIINCKY